MTNDMMNLRILVEKTPLRTARRNGYRDRRLGVRDRSSMVGPDVGSGELFNRA